MPPFSAIGGLIFSIVLSFPVITCVICFGLVFGFYASGEIWPMKEKQYRTLVNIQKQSEVRPTQVWGIRLGLHLAIMNNDTDPFLCSNYTEEELKRSLKEGWNVTNREEAFEVIGWLIIEGHRTVFKNQKIIAWDFGRLVHLVRHFYTAKYISEREAWNLIKSTTDKVQPLFHSWQEYHDSYAMGRKLWLESYGKSEDPGQYMLKVQKRLRDAEKSPVKDLPWNMLLTWEIPSTEN